MSDDEKPEEPALSLPKGSVARPVLNAPNCHRNEHPTNPWQKSTGHPGADHPFSRASPSGRRPLPGQIGPAT
ncbi:MAG: hypothetical protein GY759_11230 [Chloroflexi bacterium]|nr:hypothetical protein [Chloroflexota bacterium]